MHGAHCEWARWRLQDSAISKRDRPHTRSPRVSVWQALQWAEARRVGQPKNNVKLIFLLIAILCVHRGGGYLGPPGACG